MRGTISDELHKLSYGEEPYNIQFEARLCGGDILATVTGGTRPHIGAVALAEPANAPHPMTGEPVSSFPSMTVLTAKGHKDAMLAEMFARYLCEKYGVIVCVTAGVHVDGADKEAIAFLVRNAKTLLDKI